MAAIDRLMSERAQAWYEWRDDDPAAGKRLSEVGREAVSLGHRFRGHSAFIDAPTPAHIPYRPASNLVGSVVKRGLLVAG